MSKEKFKKRELFRSIVIFLSLVVFLPTLINAQERGIAKRPVVVVPHQDQKLARVLKKPDPDAIYLQLRAGQYKTMDASQQYMHRAKNEVIVRMEGFSINDSPGNPALPYQTYSVALPPEAETKSLRIEYIHLAEKELAGKYSIAPAPPYLLDQIDSTENEIQWEFTQWGIGKEIVQGHNILIYEKDAFFPEEYCDVKSGGQLRKWKVATIVFNPIRYNPIKAKLLLAEEALLKISFERDASYLEQEKMQQMLRDDTFDERARKLFLNYDQAKEWYLKPLREGILERSRSIKEEDDSDDPNYAIITTEDIYTNSTSLDDFCFHKQDIGFTVIVVTEHQTHTVDGSSGSYFFVDAAGGFEDVVGDYPNQRPDKIRKWLIDNYLSLGIEYVLLIGNPDPDNMEPDDLVGDIPMQICWPHLLAQHPTDLYYYDLEGDWNIDDDDFVGENYLISGSSNLPSGINGDLFCARWEGAIEVSGATDHASIKLYGYLEGQTTIWLDTDNDGFSTTDIVLEDTDVHYPTYNYIWFSLTNGIYPIKIEYRQSNSYAYCDLRLNSYTSGATAAFKHDDGTGSYANKLEADYFNDNDFSAPPDASRLDSSPNVYYIEGDKGIGGVDFYPEVIIGRIPCYDENEDGNPDYATLDAFLSKIINYENADIHEETWRRRVLASTPYMYDYDSVPGYDTADFAGAEYLMCNIAPPPLWTWTRIHPKDYGEELCDKEGEVIIPCSVDNTVDAWNNGGRGLVMWRTHGSQTGAGYVFNETRNTDLDDTKRSIVIQTTCQNGHPEVEESGGVKHYPLGYTLLNHGAIATISSTRNSAGGVFDPSLIDIGRKNNPYLLYFLAKGVFDNINVGNVLAHVRENDATLGNSWGQCFNYNLYGDPSLSLFGADPKSNNDIVFLLDGSGSMLSEGKWQAAVDGTVLFYELMKELRHPAFQDRYNTVVFRCDWAGGSLGDASTTIPPSTGLKNMFTPLTTAMINDETPIPSYWTPIGEGLNLAIDQFELDTEESFYANKTILLLSDGKHNCGVNPLDITLPEDVRVQAVGLGEDDIEPETIRDIALASDGEYRITPSPRELEDFFLQILCNTSWKLQNIPVVVDAVQIDQSQAIFIVVWDDPAASLVFELDPPGAGPNITPTNLSAYYPMECSYHSPAPGETHGYYVCKNIPNELLGEWHFTNINNGGVAVPLADVLLKVIEDPSVTADFEIDNIDHYTGQPIILTARMIEDGKPLTGLAEVYAELLRSPALAPGTLMSENKPSPHYPLQPPDSLDRTLRSHYLLGVMKKLGIDSLSRSGGPKINLRDDGLNGDLKAKDGIYTGIFNDTHYEGSYTFKFRASGETSNGVIFNRGETQSEYVKFAATPEETNVEINSIIENKQEKITVATIYVTPRDVFGSYLGPFQGNIIQLWSSSAWINSEYQDNKDGSYTYTLTYPIGSVPQVSISVGDMIVTERLEVKSPEPPLYSLSIHSGSTTPVGHFNNTYDPAYSIGLDFDYHFSSRFSLVGLLLYNHFNAGASSASDTYWSNISANFKYEFVQRVPHPFINGGPGIYIPKNGSTKAGYNIGLGVNIPLTLNLILELGADYHHVFITGNEVDFSVQHIGLIYKF